MAQHVLDLLKERGAAHKKTPSRLQSGRRETRGTTSVRDSIAESPLSRPQTRAARCIRRTGDRLLTRRGALGIVLRDVFGLPLAAASHRPAVL